MKISSSLIPLQSRPPAYRPEAGRAERENRQVPGQPPEPRDTSHHPDLAAERQRAREGSLHAAREEAGLSFIARQALGEYRKTSLGEEQAQLRELLGVDVFV